MSLIKIIQTPSVIEIKADDLKKTDTLFSLSNVVSIDCYGSWGHFTAYNDTLEVKKEDFDFNEKSSTLISNNKCSSELSIDVIRCQFSAFRGYILEDKDVHKLYTLNGLLLMEITCKHILDIPLTDQKEPEYEIQHLKNARYIHSSELDIII